MTITDILHGIADVLLMVIVFWYDRRIECLEEKCAGYEGQLRKLRHKLNAVTTRPTTAGALGWQELWYAEPTCET